MNSPNAGNLILQAIYYILVAFILFFSLFGVYTLIRFGRSRTFALILSLCYIFFFLTVLSQSYATLRQIIS